MERCHTPPPPQRRAQSPLSPPLPPFAQFDALSLRSARVDCELALLENRALAEVDAQMARVRRALRFANIRSASASVASGKT
jgi:hypothetical protein